MNQLVVNDGVSEVQLLNGAALVANGRAAECMISSSLTIGLLLNTGVTGFTGCNYAVNLFGIGTGIQNKTKKSAIKVTDVTVTAVNHARIHAVVAINFSSSDNAINVTGEKKGCIFDNYCESMS